MLKIGEFAKLGQVSIHLLRYYDKLGILTPAHIDPHTGWRFYHAEQLLRLQQILALKDLGLSLEQITDLIHDKITLDELRGMLKLKLVELQQTLETAQKQIGLVQNHLQQIEAEGQMSDDHVVLKAIPPQHMLAVCLQPWTDGQVAEHIAELSALMRRESLPFNSSAIGIQSAWQSPEFTFGYATNCHREYTLSSGAIAKPYLLAGVPLMATMLHVGARADVGYSYGRLLRWLETNSYRFAFPGRQVYLRPVPDPYEPDNLIELQLPLTKE